MDSSVFRNVDIMNLIIKWVIVSDRGILKCCKVDEEKWSYMYRVKSGWN